MPVSPFLVGDLLIIAEYQKKGSPVIRGLLGNRVRLYGLELQLLLFGIRI